MFVFDAMNLAEQRGLVFVSVREFPEKYGLPLPLVSYEEHYLVITLPRNSEAAGKVDWRMKWRERAVKSKMPFTIFATWRE